MNDEEVFERACDLEGRALEDFLDQVYDGVDVEGRRRMEELLQWDKLPVRQKADDNQQAAEVSQALVDTDKVEDTTQKPASSRSSPVYLSALID